MAGAAGQVAAEACTQPVQALPGGSEQLQIDDGDSVRETMAELNADPNVAYAVPNWRALGLPPRPTTLGSGSSGTCSAPTASTWSRPGRWRKGLGAPAGRGAVVALLDSGVAYERRGRYRRAPDLRRSTFVRPYDFIEKGRPPERRVRPWHARSGDDRPDDEQPASPRPASPTTRRSCRCACSTRTARRTRPRSRGRSATPPATAPT